VDSADTTRFNRLTTSANINDQPHQFQVDGVVVIKGVFADWIDTLRAGVERNLRCPSSLASENLHDTDNGRFFDDYCNWRRIPEFERFVFDSQAAAIAAHLMHSSRAQVFHDHVLVKEPGTTKATPWHQDAPYYFVDGTQTVSLWLPLDPVGEATLRCVAGSHIGNQLTIPTRWLSGEAFYASTDEFAPVVDPDTAPEQFRVVEQPLEPGDAVAFSFRTLHGARGNTTAERRRAFTLRFIGDDARYIARPGPTSPPFHGHDMKTGQRLREDWFPTIYNCDG
jgi:ectoine hydroxylase-related dioxygenase (phytanoyl-CoA dioxygenase family)